MYLSAEVLRHAFSGMSNLDVSHTGGKARQERASAIAYLFAVSNVLKQVGGTELDLSVSQRSNRTSLRLAVENFLSVPGTARYTADFYEKFSNDPGVGSNFLTTVVAGTRGKNIPREYPGRPAPLLSILQEKIALLGNIAATLSDVYQLSGYKVPLVLWSLKEYDFGQISELDADSVNAVLQLKYEANLSATLSVSREEIDAFKRDLPHGQWQLVQEMPNLEDLYVDTAAYLPATQAQQTASLESEFRSWLNGQEFSAKSINSYAGSSIATAEKIAHEANLIGGDKKIYQIHQADQIKSLLDRLEENGEWLEKNTAGNSMFRAGVRQYAKFLSQRSVTMNLPKPFLLLAGISGTGKSRFVRKQAEANSEPFELVAVRPDWHEPSDLLGYVSRINGEKYVVTPFLKFLVGAWQDAFASFEGGALELKPEMKTFWLCLDEMNLAPVEQYFADYLSILETRSWNDGVYSSAALIRPSDLEEDARRTLRDELGLEESGALWQFFMKSGIQLAPNLVVAGTVNMDETTHGFSRKVIDRAYTIDFGEFFPNVFDEFFNQTTRPVKLSYSNISSVPQSGPGAAADSDGQKSIAFLSWVNQFLEGTSFQLAYRALNELLVSVACLRRLMTGICMRFGMTS